MQKLTDQGCHALLYAITNRKDEISFRIRWTQTFWKRIWSVSHSIAPSTLTAKRLTTGTESLRNKNTLSCKCDQFYVDNLSLPVSLAATRVVPIPFPRALTRSADLALWPVDMFTISCSSHFNGWIIWLLMTPVILFTPSFQLACWWPRGTWCHPDPSVSLPLSALTLLSELEELASISPWLLGAE